MQTFFYSFHDIDMINIKMLILNAISAGIRSNDFILKIWKQGRSVISKYFCLFFDLWERHNWLNLRNQ